MSSILKALKKLEDENNARTPDSLKINAEILRGGDSARPSTPGILLAALLLFLCGGVVMYLFMKPGGNRPTALSFQTPVERPVPVAIVPAAPVLQTPPAAPQPAENPKLSSTATSSSSGVKAGRINPPAARNAAKRQPVPAIARPTTEQPEIPIVAAQPLVRVNGIAFQDGSDSVAVINGVPVSRGALIEGVKVEEIQRDRVQFSYGGEKFEVFLGKTNH